MTIDPRSGAARIAAIRAESAQQAAVTPESLPAAPVVDLTSANNARYQRLVAEIDQTFQRVDPVTFEVEDLPLTMIKERAKNRIRTWRWEKSIGGTVMSNGMFLPTDTDTRALIHQTMSLIDTGVKEEPFKYDIPGGGGAYLMLMKTDLVAMAAVSSVFVQQCFDDGIEIQAQIEAATTAQDIRTILTTYGA